MAGPHFRYSRWDGTQVGFDLDAEAILEEITDDLLYHGDLHAALRRMMQQGFRDRNGEQLMGMRDLMERLRRQRRDRLEQHDLGGVYEEIAEALREVLDTEREGLDELAREAAESGDQRRQEITDQVVAERNLQLDMLPPDLAGMVKELQQYEFTSSEARERFDELMEQLRAAARAELLQPDGRGHAGRQPRDHAADEGHARRAQRAARPEGGGPGHAAGLRAVHGALRRLLPREPGDPRRAARADGPAHGGHAVDAQLDDARAAGPAPGPVRAAPRGHGPALADGPARRPPAAAVPADGLGAALRLLRPGPPRLRRGRRRC